MAEGFNIYRHGGYKKPANMNFNFEMMYKIVPTTRYLAFFA